MALHKRVIALSSLHDSPLFRSNTTHVGVRQSRQKVVHKAAKRQQLLLMHHKKQQQQQQQLQQQQEEEQNTCSKMMAEDVRNQWTVMPLGSVNLETVGVGSRTRTMPDLRMRRLGSVPTRPSAQPTELMGAYNYKLGNSCQCCQCFLLFPLFFRGLSPD